MTKSSVLRLLAEIVREYVGCSVLVTQHNYHVGQSPLVREVRVFHSSTQHVYLMVNEHRGFHVVEMLVAGFRSRPPSARVSDDRRQRLSERNQAPRQQHRAGVPDSRGAVAARHRTQGRTAARTCTSGEQREARARAGDDVTHQRRH